MSENTFNKMIENSYDSNAEFVRAYPSPEAYFWDQNFVNGQYVIAYELNNALNQNVGNMLPQVYWYSVEIKPEIFDHFTNFGFFSTESHSSFRPKLLNMLLLTL